MEKDKKTLLKDISKATGYSISTISRAINGGGYVKEDKKSIIINEGIKRGYFKNILSNISIFSTIVVFVPFKIIVLQTRGLATFYSEIIEDLKKESNRLDIHMDLVVFEDNLSLKTLIKSHATNKVNGIIAVGFSKEHINILNKTTHKPIMLVNSQIYSKDFNSISPDNRAIGYQCTEYLLTNGHKNILHITNDARKTIYDRALGFKEALLDHDIDFNENNCLSIPADENYINNAEIEQNVIDTIKKNNITAIFGSKDTISISLLEILKKNNLSIPDDISIISVDNDKVSRYSYPTLTTYELPKKEIAVHAIQSLIYQQILLRKTTLKVQLYGKLIERNSVKDISKL